MVTTSVDNSGHIGNILFEPNLPLNWKTLLTNGFELKTSGTSGNPKTIFQTPEKLFAANRIALDAQKITRKSRILTVCSMSHAGGTLAQTLPALSIGAHVKIKSFNAYSFWRDIQSFTHTHLTPAHCEILIQTKNFKTIDLAGLFITCGSDNVSFQVINAFVQHGAIFMCNWGMTEAGPITINTIFDSRQKVETYMHEAVPSATIMGDRYYCDYTIKDNALWIKGDTCVYDDWFNTQDIVALNNKGALYHAGRIL